MNPRTKLPFLMLRFPKHSKTLCSACMKQVIWPQNVTIILFSLNFNTSDILTELRTAKINCEGRQRHFGAHELVVLYHIEHRRSLPGISSSDVWVTRPLSGDQGGLRRAARSDPVRTVEHMLPWDSLSQPRHNTQTKMPPECKSCTACQSLVTGSWSQSSSKVLLLSVFEQNGTPHILIT